MSKPFVFIIEPTIATVYYSEDGKRCFSKNTAYARTARYRTRQLRRCTHGHGGNGCGGSCEFKNHEWFSKVLARYARMLKQADKSMDPAEKEMKRLLKLKITPKGGI